MENTNNRYFYKVDDDSEKLRYRHPDDGGTRNGFIRFICRIPDDLLLAMDCEFSGIRTEKKNTDFGDPEIGNRDYVKQYEFDVIPYDNSKARDVIANHSVIVTYPEFVEEVKHKIRKVKPTTKFTKHQTKKHTGYSITTQLYDSQKIAGSSGWTTENHRDPTYPICVLSYKRANKYGRTHLLLTKMKIKHYLFIEPSQRSDYEKWYDSEFCELVVYGSDLSDENMGGTPARNFILDWGNFHNFERVWMLDDNIKGYLRLYQGQKYQINSPVIFTHIEDYVERYDNVGAVSHNFNPFVREGDFRKCIVKNDKSYSSMLLPTNPDVRFRYKHQEDNLMSIEFIEKGYCNLCFNSVCYDKNTSGQDGGGNRESIYKVESGGDGSGYDERLDYFLCQVKILYYEKKLTLRDGCHIKDFVTQSKKHKSHNSHAEVMYQHLANREVNQIVKRGVACDSGMGSYDLLVENQNKANDEIIWYFNGLPV